MVQMEYAVLTLVEYKNLKGLKKLRKLAEKRWGCLKEPVWNIVLRKAMEKNIPPRELEKLIRPTSHPAEVFVK